VTPPPCLAPEDGALTAAEALHHGTLGLLVVLVCVVLVAALVGFAIVMRDDVVPLVRELARWLRKAIDTARAWRRHRAGQRPTYLRHQAPRGRR
jgi:hypothetical protein